MKLSPFSPSQAQSDAEKLLVRVTAVSRNPGFFGEGRIPDTLEGRFELATLHSGLALIRMRAAPEAADTAQIFADILFRQFDSGLREAGVGDLSVPKRMRKLAGAFYGRVEVYAGAIAEQNLTALQEALVRNVLSGSASVFAGPLANYVRDTAAYQAAAPAPALFVADGWLAAPA